MTKAGERTRPQWATNIQELRNALRTPDRHRVSQARLSTLLRPFHPERRAVSQTTVGKWENAQQEPTIGEFVALAKLAQSLGLEDVSPEWLAFNRGQVPEFVRVLGVRAPGASPSGERLAVDVMPIEDEEEHPQPERPTRRAAGADRGHPESARDPARAAHGKAKRRR